ncbi:MAG: 2-C-methyl-D-erythritol 2,4-cyclodiphosphate synthase [Candidatus Aminicenantes bacterium]|nr:2-C-methyl-D-erythritol 2,4-cyclodiphosphate synthase [Candidatus Aminicenantes bacterium]
MIKLRTGIGYDIHRLKAGNGLFIGGVKISGSLMAEAHSDGDVLIHSLIDALLGAMGQPDIGELFPDSDPQFKGIGSLRLLSKVKEILVAERFEIINIDSVLIIEAPKISPFKNEIKKNVSEVLQIPQDDFNLKAKSKEKIDAVGRGEALECFSTALLTKKGRN